MRLAKGKLNPSLIEFIARFAPRPIVRNEPLTLLLYFLLFDSLLTSLTGTARYASCNVHNGIEQSRRDDVESFCYVLIYFAKGALPWQGLKSENRIQKYEKIKELKNRIPIEQLCESLPDIFFVILDHCRKLKFDETPDYKFIQQNLKLF